MEYTYSVKSIATGLRLFALAATIILVPASSAVTVLAQSDHQNKFVDGGSKTVTGPTAAEPVRKTPRNPGTDSFVPKWGKSNGLASSQLFDNGVTVGINTDAPSPKALFQVDDGSILFNGTTGAIPTQGPGTRLMWVPAQSAFRAGAAVNNEWDDGHIGYGSAAFGRKNEASGDVSFAIGDGSLSTGGASFCGGFTSTASGYASFAMGINTAAGGSCSIAFGNGTKSSGKFASAFGANTLASGDGSFVNGGGGSTAFGAFSTAFGYSVYANGEFSVSLGSNATAEGHTAIAIGNGVNASGSRSVAIGSNLSASGQNSFAFGTQASTNAFKGSFVYGDNSTKTTVSNTESNQVMMRATGGVVLYTGLNNTPDKQSNWAGVMLQPNANSWSIICDSNRKENKLTLDGEQVLDKINSLWVGSWNYKGQDASRYRHYGTTSQQFYALFGNDGFGNVGDDKTIGSADLDGINLIAVKALEQRTRELRNKLDEVEELRKENAQLSSKLLELEQMIRNLSNKN